MAVKLNQSLHQLSSTLPVIDTAKPSKKAEKSTALHLSIPSQDPHSPKKKRIDFSVTSTRSDDSLSIELDKLLKLQTTEIEKGLDELEHSKTGMLATDAFVDVKDWAYFYADTSKKAVEGGIKFLEIVLPAEILELELASDSLSDLADIMKIGGLFLKSLSFGTNTVAVICKDKLLKQSRQLLKEANDNFERRMRSSTETETPQDDQAKHDPEKIRKMLLEWKVALDEEEKTLNKEKIAIGMTGAGMFLSVSGLVANTLTPVFSQLKFAGLTFSWMLAGLSFVGSVFGLKSSIDELNLLKDWSQSYQQWQKHHHYLVDQSQDLLAKRRKIAQEKVEQLLPDFQTLKPKIEELIKKHRQETDQPFSEWYSANTPEGLGLIRFYVDHQETIELTVKNALREMIDKKHGVEEGVLHYNMITTGINFSFDTLTLILTVGLAIAGLATLPVGGIGFVLLGLSIGTTVVSGALILEKIRRAYCLKPATFMACLRDGIPTSIMFAKLQLAVRNFINHSKEQKLRKIAKVLQTLHLSSMDKNDPRYLKAYADYKQAKAHFEESQAKAKTWTKQLNTLQNTLRQKGWEDFVSQASLQMHKEPEVFDTLRSLNNALQEANFSLLSEETKILFENHLGIDLKALQIQFEKDPEAIKSALQNFFVLDDSKLLSFISTQQDRMNPGLIQTPEMIPN